MIITKPLQMRAIDMFAQCYNYKGHTIYTDGRVYRDYELIRETPYATDAAAKAAATRNWKRIRSESFK